ncbi:myocardin-related transcription factor B-like isoform X2 [Xyrauchen texanus]|uniref:myocardin-related transcription factor B-like isoform X2 n=1 Tax=Xyrauchen texanus TaxID=154827 RepID=UPI002242C580|nr:myocardin-related transcription factor B-like isoform X2 [Xyrauchen texanus]
MEDQGGAGFVGLLAPSPQSVAVTHEMGELSLHPSQKLPPLNERKNVLQLRLQQRRTREQLVDQGIMPSLKSPAAFHEQIRSLERARTENFLKHKIRSRPERAELVRMHILQETAAVPSLQATQLRLKRARLADDLNEKIAQRPGPMELVEKNILPVDSSVKEAIIDGQMQYPKTLEDNPIDEDSGDALSPDQPGSQESQGSAASPGEARTIEETSPLPNILLQRPPVITTSRDFLKPFSTSEQLVSPRAPMIQPVITVAPFKSGHTHVKSQPKLHGDKSRSKKCKEAKPRVKKLKYHQYIPPDQKQEPDQAPMDSAYARLLQQQQLFLQLQILSQQQQQHYNFQTILPAPLKPVIEGQNSSATVAINSTSSLPASIVVSLPTATPVRPNSTVSNRKAGTLPARLEEMKVAELKMELKLRGLPVSGTKMDLIERLKPFQDNPVTAAPINYSGPNTKPCGTLMDVSSTTTTLFPYQLPSENMSSTPPMSPGSSELQSREEACMEGQAEAQNCISNNVVKAALAPKEQDQRLHEKERQIKELLRKLEQEQKLVEELKMQLEVEKRSGQTASPVESNTISSPAIMLASVKTESTVPANCTLGSHTTPMLVTHPTQVTPAPLPQFIISHQGVQQVIGQPQTLLTTQHGGTQILFPMPLANNTTTIQVPNTNVKLQPVLQATVSPSGPGLIQTTQPQPVKAESPTSQQLVSHNHIRMNEVSPHSCINNLPLDTCEGSVFQHGASENPALEMPHHFLSSFPQYRISPRAFPIPPSLINGPLNKSPFIQKPSAFSQMPKNREPPCYEEAVKQTRNLQNPAVTEIPTATSQQMDDLFDILIESGEITPFIQQDQSVSKMMPVTACITTLPINTALSRPPAQVQMAPPPALIVEPMPSLAYLDSDNQVEALLEGTLVGNTEPEQRTLGLLEELQNQILEHPNSPMDTSELGFSDSPPPLSFSLQETDLDNMEWLDLTMPGLIGRLNPLGITSEFLDMHELHLHWD